ncbi:MAG: hypothetical protein EZS28_056056 [Streblomastix strix]|uniref:Uncharacterized protein n=1 Tax=Streblomastix strix TaxID=222440 RepID=A0A5J4PSU2_9EUKA|nr:MAG: hypothetical protein EZS28_056056 [Streblomastix strix]
MARLSALPASTALVKFVLTYTYENMKNTITNPKDMKRNEKIKMSVLDYLVCLVCSFLMISFFYDSALTEPDADFDLLLFEVFPSVNESDFYNVLSPSIPDEAQKMYTLMQDRNDSIAWDFKSEKQDE